jgi:diaminohydroxyphosphoribosylaminopyrimidine deaminase/5-amino-6-(5-phosphoribosylamino)uracil reductase
MVGAVIVKGGSIIGQGFHQAYGGPHAEVNALARAGRAARGADLYVNLEPCCHYGKTPPCVPALLEHGLRRVYVGMADPNPAVRGRGIAALRRAGVTVEVGLLEQECRRLNEQFIKFITTGMPFVMLKAALTLDGKIATATGDSRWITGPEARRHVHGLRSRVDAVMVGIGTVVADDPLLTVRLTKKAGRSPRRIIIDPGLRIPRASRLLRTSREADIIIATDRAGLDTPRARAIRKTGAELLGLPLAKGRIDFKELLRALAARNIASILIEGGAETNAAALEAGAVDKIIFYYAPRLIGSQNALSVINGRGPAKIADALRIENISIRAIKEDFVLEGYLRPCLPESSKRSAK